MRKTGTRKPRVIKIPKCVAHLQLFQPLYKLLDDITKGEVDEAVDANGTRVVIYITYKNNGVNNSLCNAGLYVQQWCLIWDEISKNAQLNVQTSALNEIANRLLTNNMEFDINLINKAREEVDIQKGVLQKVPGSIIAKAFDKPSL